MVEKIKLSYQELKSLSKDSFYTFSVLNWWLLKYDDLYKSLKKSEEVLCEKCNELKKQNLPFDCLLSPSYCVKTRVENIFIKHYENLDYFTQIYKCEDKCLSAIEVFNMTTISDENTKRWLINNYELWKENVFEFGVFHLDNDDVLIELMKLYNPIYSKLDFTILVERTNFKSIEEFLLLYSTYFYENRLYPEKLEFIGY